MKIIGQSPKIQEVLRVADLVAGTDVPVLITGETGTGKDLFARRIHKQSSRKLRPFVKVACASLVDGLLDVIKKTRSGTLLLDEIADLPENLQIQLLHFIETGELTSSEAKTVKFDVRIIVSTQQNLHKSIEQNGFRADLFYRLNVIPVELPNLKERDADISLLMDFFFRQLVKQQHQVAPVFSKAALKQIMRYNWPGNVRELYNFCERMFILFSGKQVDVTNLPHELKQASYINPFGLPASGIKLEQLEVDLIYQALETSGGNKSKAARLLGLTRDTFLYRLKKYSIQA